jgi:uncharacterized protein (DUF2147 family)
MAIPHPQGMLLVRQGEAMKLRDKMVLAGLIGLLFSFSVHAEIQGDSIIGKWLTAPDDGGRSHIEIVESGGIYSARIIWLELPTYPEDDEEGMGGQERIDRRNPDQSKQQDPILGLKILDGLGYEGQGEWKGGTIYDPNNGKTYKSQMKLGDGDTLAVRGFIGFSFIGRSTEWTRVPTPARTDK